MIESRMETSCAPVILVEDEPCSARLLLRAYEKAAIPNPLQVHRDAESALSVLLPQGEAAKSDAPAMVMTDLRLPRASGLDLIRSIRRQPAFNQTPCVVLSASGNPDEVIESYRAGANLFLLKPPRFADLQRMVVSIHSFFFGTRKGSTRTR